MNSKNSYRLFLILTIMPLLVLSVYPLCIAVQNTDNTARTQKLIAQMRKAIYGEIKLEDIKGVSLRWVTYHQRLNGDRDIGEAAYDLLLPNKLASRSTRNLSGNQGQIVTQSLLNREQSETNVSVSNNAIPVMREDGGSIARSNDYQVKQLQSLRREQAFQLVQLMLPPSPDFPLSFTYVGETKASDGQADVVDVKGPDDFLVRLYVDKATSRLLMMTFRDPSNYKIKTTTRELKNNDGKSIESLAGGSEVKVRFSNYKQVDGIMLPHLVTYENNGRIVSERELKSFKLNPTFEPNHFELSKKRK